MKKCYNLDDFERLAKRALPSPIYDYLIGGADTEWSVQNNLNAFARYSLMPRVLRDVSTVDTSVSVLGAKLDMPVILSPTGTSRIFHHDKELGAAKAAERAGVMYALSTLGTTSIEDVAAVKPGPKMFQIYIHKDRSLTQDFVDRAKAANYDALCLTVDTQLAGNRERDKRSGFGVPLKLTPRSLLSFVMHPGWTLNLLRNSDFNLANISHRVAANKGGPGSVIGYVNAQFDRTVTWDDVASIIERWGGPFAIKGLQAPGDAKRAVDVGASAIMISNHGGRQMDYAPAPIDCVEPIRDSIGDALELIVDGGVRRGTDIIKARALGANAVSIGRPYLFALAAYGEKGVADMLRLLKEELERDLALLGLKSLDDVSEVAISKV
ncbi:MAG: alpha-hydroxy acid oxidase [Pseudomonadota bacterium]